MRTACVSNPLTGLLMTQNICLSLPCCAPSKNILLLPLWLQAPPPPKNRWSIENDGWLSSGLTCYTGLNSRYRWPTALFNLLLQTVITTVTYMKVARSFVASRGCHHAWVFICKTWLSGLHRNVISWVEVRAHDPDARPWEICFRMSLYQF